MNEMYDLLDIYISNRSGILIHICISYNLAHRRFTRQSYAINEVQLCSKS